MQATSDWKDLRVLARVILPVPIWFPLLTCIMQLITGASGTLEWLGGILVFGVLFIIMVRWMGGTVRRGLLIWLSSFGLLMSAILVFYGFCATLMFFAGEGKASGLVSIGSLVVGIGGCALCDWALKGFEQEARPAYSTKRGGVSGLS
jgi:hypothetical protein